MNSYSRFSHQLRFHLTKPDLTPPRKLFTVLIRVWHGIPVLNQAAELNVLAWFGPPLSQEEERVTGACAVTDVPLNSPWTRESLCPVSSEYGWDLHTSTCTRLRACLYAVLSLLLFRLSFWRSILISAPMLPPPSSECKRSCSCTGSYVRDLTRAKSNLAWGGEKSIFNSDPIRRAVCSPLCLGKGGDAVCDGDM